MGNEVARSLARLMEIFGGPRGATISIVLCVSTGFVLSGWLDIGRSCALGAAAALLVNGAAVFGACCRGSLGPFSARAGIAPALAGLLYGSAAALVPAVLAPHGVDPMAVDPWIMIAGVALGVACSPRGRIAWWTACSVGIGLALVFGFRALPKNADWAGFDSPSKGSNVEVVWSPDGVRVEIVSPIDESVTVVNGLAVRPSIEAARERLNSASADCPDADGEERAAAEAVISGDQGQAIARARLALQICPESSFAGQVLGRSLMNRGVTRLRTGQNTAAMADLEEALSVLRPAEDRAQAHLALGRVLLSLKRHGDARQHFQRAVVLAPSHPAGRLARQIVR